MAVNWLLGIGVAINLLNLGDFILRPEQKKAFQGALESAVLWMDYQKPLAWIRYLRLLRRRHLCVLSLTTFGVMSLLFCIPNPSRVVGMLCISLFFWGLLLLGGTVYWQSDSATEVLEFLKIDGKPSTFVIRSFAVFFGILVLQVIMAIASQVEVIGAALGLLNLILIVAYARWYSLLQVAVPASLISLSASAALFAATAVLVASRAIGWRIVEYSKGAWSAVILVATVGLSVYKVWASS